MKNKQSRKKNVHSVKSYSSNLTHMENMNHAGRRLPAVGMAVVAGLVAGVAAGLFLRSEKGQGMTEELKKKTKRFQRELRTKLREVKELSKEKYEEIIDDLVDQYAQTKVFAKNELKKLKEYLMDQWEDVREQMQEYEGEDETVHGRDSKK